jgi:cytoskeletal protein CcmA (bactofilin family)
MKIRRNASEQISGFLDKGTNVTGELEYSGTLRIDGNFHGSINTADILIVGEHALVHADIKVGEIEVHGKVFGNIESTRRVEIFPSGQVSGEIQTPILIMAPGAMLDGKTSMTGDRPVETTFAATSDLRQGTQSEV